MGVYCFPAGLLQFLGVDLELLLDTLEIFESAIQLARDILGDFLQLGNIALHLTLEVADLVGSLGVDPTHLVH